MIVFYMLEHDTLIFNNLLSHFWLENLKAYV